MAVKKNTMDVVKLDHPVQHVLFVLLGKSNRGAWLNQPYKEYLQSIGYNARIATELQEAQPFLNDPQVPLIVFGIDERTDEGLQTFKKLRAKLNKKFGIVGTHVNGRLVAQLQRLGVLFVLEAPVSRNRMAIALRRALPEAPKKQQFRGPPPMNNTPVPEQKKKFSVYDGGKKKTKDTPKYFSGEKDDSQGDGLAWFFEPNASVPEPDDVMMEAPPLSDVVVLQNAVDTSPFAAIAKSFEEAFRENPFLQKEKTVDYLQAQDVYVRHLGKLWDDLDASYLMKKTMKYYDAKRMTILFHLPTVEQVRAVIDSEVDVDRYIGMKMSELYTDLPDQDVMRVFNHFQEKAGEFFPSFDLRGQDVRVLVPFYSSPTLGAGLILELDMDSAHRDKIVHEFYHCFDVGENLKKAVVGKSFLVKTYMRNGKK